MDLTTEMGGNVLMVSSEELLHTDSEGLELCIGHQMK